VWARRALEILLLKCILALLTAIIVPVMLFILMRPPLRLASVDMDEQKLRQVFYPLTLAVLVGTRLLGQSTTIFATWAERIRMEEYLVGEQLHNIGD
jgi:hypothetical protein